MRFTCEKSLLATGLNIASRTVAQKSSISVIEGILCQADRELSLTGYNMETAITYTIDAEIDAVDTKFGKIAKGVSARGQASFNIDTVNKNVEMPSDRLYFDGQYYQASATNLAYGSLGYPAVFYNTQSHAYEIHALDSSLAENTISEHCRFIAYINKTNPWQSSSALKYTVDGKTEFAELEYPIAGKNAIFENWCYPKSFSYNGTMNNLYVGIVQMNNGKQGVLQYNKQTHTISRHVFNDFSTLDSHNAMAVVVMPAVSVLRIRLPSVMGVMPFSWASAISSSAKPPSGPMNTPTLSPLKFCTN